MPSKQLALEEQQSMKMGLNPSSPHTTTNSVQMTGQNVRAESEYLEGDHDFLAPG
jgi:hypothetical protein